MDRKILLSCLAFLCLLLGCLAPKAQTPPPGEANLRFSNSAMERAPVRPAEGSLWTENVEASLYAEFRAKRVGDIVTVRIVEDPEAELNANTKTSRSSSIQARLEFLGYMKALSEKNRNLPQYPENIIAADLNSQFDGKGSSNRDGHVKAYVTCVVERVFPNGYLFIQGKREIWVNNEKQYILLSGTIRPEDVNARNEIASTYVADAEIVYSGVGPVADKQVVGWLGRIIDYVWPF